MNLLSFVVVGTKSIGVAYSSSSLLLASPLISSLSDACFYFSDVSCLVLTPDCCELFFKLRDLCISFSDGGEGGLYFDFQLISCVFQTVCNSLVVLSHFSKVVDKDLGVLNIASAFFLEILDEDKDEGEGAVDDIDSEVGEKDKYP